MATLGSFTFSLSLTLRKMEFYWLIFICTRFSHSYNPNNTCATWMALWMEKRWRKRHFQHFFHSLPFRFCALSVFFLALRFYWFYISRFATQRCAASADDALPFRTIERIYRRQRRDVWYCCLPSTSTSIHRLKWKSQATKRNIRTLFIWDQQ